MATTKSDAYRAAFELAQQNLDSTNPMDFEVSVPTRGKELGLTVSEYQQFSADARNFRIRFGQLKAQDDAAAVAAAKAAAGGSATGN